MQICYKKLWKLLIDKDMKKVELAKAANISTSTLSKLVKGENVNTNVLLKVCRTLHCDIGDIGEVIHDFDSQAM